MSKFSLISIILFSIAFAKAQVSYTALITEPSIGSEESAKNLIRVIEDINKRKDISRVIVLGNVTANGKIDELTWAQEILDGLFVPYFIIGGERDYSNIGKNDSDFSLLWSDNKEILYDKNVTWICINTFIQDFPEKNHIEPETLLWFQEALSKSKSKQIVTFSYYPLSKSDNGEILFESMLDYKVHSFVSKDAKQSKQIQSTEGFYLNRKNDWGYILISAKKDSIIIKKIVGAEVKNKIKPEINKSVFTSLTLIKSSRELNTFSSLEQSWIINFKKSILLSPLYDNKNIFAAFKYGDVVCFTNGGKEKWRYDYKTRIQFPPLVNNDLLIIATADGDIFTLNTETGPPVQTIGIGENITGLTIAGNSNVKNETNVVIAGTASGRLYCYNLLTFEPIWTNEISEAAIHSSIIYSDNKIFLLDEAGILYCVSADNGLLIWKISSAQGGWKNKFTNFKNYLKVVGSNLFLIDEAGNLFCVDALLGMNNWNMKNIEATPIIRLKSESELIIPTKKNKILAISINSKKIINEISLPQGGNTLTDLCIIGNNILASFDDGFVYLIKPNQIPEKIFRNSSAPVVSIINVNDECLVTDYDGNFTLLKINGKIK